jgi:SSS family solute:Na+ symporter/sodium/proline symporter
MAALFYKKATKTAAIASAFAGVVVNLMTFAAKYNGLVAEGIEPILLALIASAVAMIGVSHLTYKESTATVPLLH